MTWFSSLVSYSLATASVLFVSLPSLKVNSAGVNFTQTTPTITQTVSPTTKTKSNEPKRLTITVNVSNPKDLKLQEGQIVKEGDIISDRISEKTRLTSQQKQLQLSLNRLKAVSITPPASPQIVPKVLVLPPISYLEYEAAVEKTKAAIASISSLLELKKQEINYLSQIKNLDPIIVEHEQIKLKELQQTQIAAVRDYQLAMGKLSTAKDSRKYQEYQASVIEAQRIEQMNQARLNYQQQLATYEQRLADREFQVSQLQAKLNDVENAIASLAQVKAPYSGTVRRIKFLGQNPDGSLTAQIILMAENRERN